MKYKVALHQDEEGYSVSVPGLPGCWSQGETEVEALSNIQDAIREYLEARTSSFARARSAKSISPCRRAEDSRRQSPRCRSGAGAS